MSNVLTNVNLPALVEMLQTADDIRVQGSPRINIEKITWNGPEPYFVLTSIGHPKLRSIWNGTEWIYQGKEETRLDINAGKEFPSITAAYEAIAEARPKHPKHKPAAVAAEA